MNKRQLIDSAFGELAMAGYDFDIGPDEYQSALNRLDGLMGTWAAKGVNVGYNFGASLDMDSGVSQQFAEAVFLALAIRWAAGKGKAVAATTKTSAKDAWDSMMVSLAYQQLQDQQCRSGTPRGAGSKVGRAETRPYLPQPTDDLIVDGVNFGT